MDLTEKQKKRVESVFHEALSLPQEQREEYLAKACAEDESVRLEAVSLLRHYESASDLKELGKPRSELAANLPLPERIGSYEVLRRLGRGGMGEVYLARDPRLGRKVAVKVLAPAIVESKGALDRLRREALAASALNHPNILTVHEFGETDGTQYIVTEYVEGKSLRELIGELSVQQAIGYARQIGEALAAAHKAGIIHRDIKPENVMVRPDGYVKVVDFGLAKAAPLEGEGTTSIQQKLADGSATTAPGMLIGTISYMSPEQVRGQEVDQRTDVWSWGVVLYEMLTGGRPFEGETASDVVAAILGKVPEIPRGIYRFGPLFSTVLAKDPTRRPTEMSVALAELVGAGSASPLFGWTAKMRSLQRSFGAKVALLVLFVLTVMILAKWLAKSGEPVAVRSRIVPLTSTGNVLMSAISPDGDYVAYAQGDKSSQSLRLRQISTGGDTEKLAPAGDELIGITLSSGYIYYVRQDSQRRGWLYRMPMLAGGHRLVAENVDSPVSFAPDGYHFVFMRSTDVANGKSTALFVRDIRDGTEKLVTSARPHDYFFTAPMWSVDGSTIVVGAFDDQNRLKIIRVRAADGSQQELPNRGWSWFRKLAWFDGKRLLVLGGTPNARHGHFMLLSLANGDLQDLTSDLSDYMDLDTIPSGGTATAIQEGRLSSIWIVPSSGRTEARRLATAGTRFYWISWSPAGKLIWQTENAGRIDLWRSDPQTGTAEPLTDDGEFKMFPETSPDSRYVIYTSNKDGTYHLWKADVSGGNAIRLTSNHSAEEEGTFTPDGKWVVFTMLTNGRRALWRVPIEGGAPTLISQAQAMKASVSPDGKLIACEYHDETSGKVLVAILKLETGELIRTFPQVPVETGARLRWAPDGKGFFYLETRDGVTNIWKQPADGGNPSQVTHFKDDEIFYFALSPDGEYFACVRGRKVSDAVLIHFSQ
jgi:Tol biopolymer transport system component